jgi:hypothetical protein
LTFSFWIYSIGTYGHDRIVDLGLKPMNIFLFKVNVGAVATLLLVVLALSAIQGDTEQPRKQTFDFTDIPYVIGGLYLLFAMVQTIIFTCKTIAKLELKREVLFEDYFNNVLLMFFFFIGIWLLQPKVNRLLAKDREVAFS